MRFASKTLTLISLSLLSATALGNCEYPPRIDIPNGAEASKEDMLAGQKAIKSYMDTMNTYLDCIEEETASAKTDDESDEITKEREALLSKRHNAAIDEMERIAAEFNVQVRAYKEQTE